MHTKIKQNTTASREAQTRHGTHQANRNIRVRSRGACEGGAERPRACDTCAHITIFLDNHGVPCRMSVGEAVSDAEAERSGARVRERQAKSEGVP